MSTDTGHHWPTETENEEKNEGHEEAESDLLRDLPDWVQDFRENLVDESCFTKPRWSSTFKDRDIASSSHELPIESRAKVEPGTVKHSTRTFRRTQIAISV